MAGTGDNGDTPVTTKSQVFPTTSQSELCPKGVAFGEENAKIKTAINKYPELENLFFLHHTIGNGGFSKVKMATDCNTGDRVAIKIVNKDHVESELPRIDLEVATLKPISHPHIINLMSVINSPKHIFMIMEYCPTDLYDYIVKHDEQLPLEVSRVIFIQLVSAVSHLHALGIVHRDLKPENVLLDANRNVKLTDFGLCAVPGKSGVNRAILKTLCGSPAYCAPELLKGPPYIGSKVDVWSLGVMLFVLLVGQLPFYSKNLKDLYKKIKDGHYSTPESLSENAKNLIDRMLDPNVSSRPSIHRLWSHPWILEGELEPFEQQISQSQRILEESESRMKIFSWGSSKPKIHDSPVESKIITANDIDVPSMIVPYIDMSDRDCSCDSASGGESIELQKMDDEGNGEPQKSVLNIHKPINKHPMVRCINWGYKKTLNGFKKFRQCLPISHTNRKRISREDMDIDEPLSVDLKTLIFSPKQNGRTRQRKGSGIIVVDEPYADCILDKIQLTLQSMGIQSQRKGSSLKHGVTSPCKFKFEIISLDPPCNLLCVRRKYLFSQDPKLVVNILQKILLLSQQPDVL